MNSESTGWMSLILLLNEIVGLDGIVSRQELLKEQKAKNITIREKTWTLDNYRRYLTRAKYLTVIKRGVYRLVKRIPETLTLRGCKRVAYDSFETRKHT